MTKFKVKDQHVAFVNAIVGGMQNYKAYQQHIGRNCSKPTAASNASGLLKRPEIQELMKKARDARDLALQGHITRQVADEFRTVVLTVDELDAYHSAIVQGMIEVVEVVPVYRWQEVVNAEGKVVKRMKEANFVSVKRPPNIREKQISMDALYKRGGHYPATRIFGAFKNLDADPEGGDENVQRVVILSNGERIPFQ